MKYSFCCCNVLCFHDSGEEGNLIFLTRNLISMEVRARWFQLFVIEYFGQLLDRAGYREKHFRLYGFGLGGLLYPPEALPMWQDFFQRVQKRFSGFLLLISDLMLAIFTKPSSVTKRNIMDGVDKLVGMAYTPHQCSYSDRKTLTGRKVQTCPNMLQKH